VHEKTEVSISASEEYSFWDLANFSMYVHTHVHVSVVIGPDVVTAGTQRCSCTT